MTASRWCPPGPAAGEALEMIAPLRPVPVVNMAERSTAVPADGNTERQRDTAGGGLEDGLHASRRPPAIREVWRCWRDQHERSAPAPTESTRRHAVAPA